MKLHITLILKFSLIVNRSWLSKTHSRDITMCRYLQPQPHFGEEFSKKPLILDYDPAIHKDDAVITIDNQKFILKNIELEATAGGGQKAKCHAYGMTSVEISVSKTELLGFNFDAKARKATRQRLAATKVLSTVFQ